MPVKISKQDVWDCIIIGGGPAGYTAGIYAGRAALRTLVLGGYKSGGQLMIATDVEDFPGFPKGVKGPELTRLMREQVERFVEKIADVDVSTVDFSKRPFKVVAENKTYLAKVVIVATGASAKWLGLPNEKRLIGKGVSSCAVCDGWFFKGKHIAVIGGGDTALREALYLANVTGGVTVVHRRSELRAQEVLQKRAFADKRIKFVWNATVDDILGKDRVDGLKLKDVKTGKASELKVDGVFVAIGHTPNTGFLPKQMLDEKGFVAIKGGVPGHSSTSVPGVFAAGDVYDYTYMQAVTAAAGGCIAAQDAHRFLEAEKGGD
jgi:thioredoxin reductase (NADPH)